jgi:hypothetical protein
VAVEGAASPLLPPRRELTVSSTYDVSDSTRASVSSLTTTMDRSGVGSAEVVSVSGGIAGALSIVIGVELV